MSGGEVPYIVQSNNSGTAMQKQLYKTTWHMPDKRLCPKEAVLHEILKKWP